MRMTDRVRAAVLGASGYGGGELIRLLAGHPEVELGPLAAHSSAGRTLAEVHPHLAGLPGSDEPLSEIDPGGGVAADVAFCSLPHGASGRIVPALVEAGVQVVDLGGDFRLKAADYPEWYGFEHPAPGLLDEAVYGLPELFADRVGGARLIANPGCYPTSVILGVAPLLAAGLIEGPIRVDGKTGLSGAGRAATEATSFASSEESIRPYRVPSHQHTPEMERGLELATGTSVSVVFVPHLVPTVRGVLTTSYATTSAGTTTGHLTDALVAAYAEAPFVRVMAEGEMADSKRTRGTNLVELQAVADPRTGTAVIVGAVDNLVKGAAGQAIQNLNLSRGFDETAGLPTLAVVP